MMTDSEGEVDAQMTDVPEEPHEENQPSLEDDISDEESSPGEEVIHEGTAKAAVSPETGRKKKCKMKRTSAVPHVTKSKPGSRGGPRVHRIQRSYVVRTAPSKYPTEIEHGVAGLHFPPQPLTDAVSEPLKSFLGVLRVYMGHDPSSLTFPVLEDRILRSTKAIDESDSEHFQRIASALQIVNTIKRGRVSTLQDLVTLAQKEINEDRQHERYTEAIRIKRDKTNSEISKDEITQRELELDLAIKQRRESHLGLLSREVEAKHMRAKLALYDSFPDRPLFGVHGSNRRANFDARVEYMQSSIK